MISVNKCSKESADESDKKPRNAVVGRLARHDRADTLGQYKLLGTGHGDGHPRHRSRRLDRRGSIARLTRFVRAESSTVTRHWPAARECGRIHNNAEGFTMSTAKEELSRLIQGQPEDSSREEIVRELAFHVMVERGLADSDAKRTISNEEIGRRIRSWQK